MASNTPNLRIRIRQNASVKEKTLIRVVAETLKKLVHLYQVKNSEDILTSLEIQSLRYKLKECLSRLMFLEPLEFGQKAEDTVWKSIFYEPIRIFKRELKNTPNLLNSKSVLLAGFKRHIMGAIGYYQKLIMRLQTEYGFVGSNCPDFAFDVQESKVNNEVPQALKAWSFSCIQHCLLYIGDLYRYEHDIKSPHSRNLAIRYYNLVLELNPSLGHAYNQLATLDTLSYYGLHATYYYLKAQLCSHSFTQSKDNLVILFERNVKRLRSVLDRESLMKKSGCNMNRNSFKIFRVKSSIIKYLNLWHSFTNTSEMDNDESKQLAIMCDDVLNNLSYVLGFDRKLVPESNSSTGVRPSNLNCQTVSEILIIANGCLELISQKKEQEENIENLKNMSTLDLAYSFTLNLYGHVFNQCLVRIRDEIRAANIDVSLLFHRYDNQETSNATNDENDDFASHEVSLAVSQTISNEQTKPKKKKMTLSKRLVRVKHDSVAEQSLDDDLSEDEKHVVENCNVLWDDELSDDSSESDNGKGFGFTESEEETDFESDEEIHSQDEDDQIIRAIVGSSTVFGRQQSNDKESKRTKIKEAEKMTYCGITLPVPNTDLQKPKQRTFTEKKTLQPSLFSTPSVDVLSRCIKNIDLLQSLTVFSQSMHYLSKGTLDSFNRVWNTSPYLWKHFSVLLNFCENLLDDFSHSECSSSSVSGFGCVHIQSDVRKVVPVVLPEDMELKGSLLALSDVENCVVCDNGLHHVISRLNRIIKCGLHVTSIPNGPLNLQKNSSGNLWLFSYSHNAPRANLVSRSWIQICSSAGTQPSSTAAKEKFMREMARLRLENEFSSNSDTEDNKDQKPTRAGVIKSFSSTDIDLSRAVYLIPDVNVLCSRLDIIKSLLRTQQYIIVIPQALIQRLDRKKTNDHGARQAIKYLESEMQLNNEHIKIEAAITARTPDIACELISDWPSIETSAIRMAQLATPASVSGCDIVVTVLTEQTHHLSAAFIAHYASLRVDFKANIDL